VPGTQGIENVRQHFVRFFQKNLPQWEILFENFTQDTPLHKDVFFSNLIIRRDPPFVSKGFINRLTLVAHYDSLGTVPGFIGAIDSAAPCAMLIHMARSIDSALTQKYEAMQLSGEYNPENVTGIQILFLDGEEAFVQWGPNDSLYGSK
jgi:glutaminyl-peptide cyclotransferase